MPVLGVIEPAVNKIVETSRSGQVGVIGTTATIESRIYEKKIKKLAPNFSIQSQACPLFVPLAEEGLGKSNITKLVSKHYLSSIKGVDTLHLGCTHYPLLKEVIREVIGKNVTIIDSALPTAEELKKTLIKNDLLNSSTRQPIHRFYVTDDVRNATKVAERFLGKKFPSVIQQIKLS